MRDTIIQAFIYTHNSAFIFYASSFMVPWCYIHGTGGLLLAAPFSTIMLSGSRTLCERRRPRLDLVGCPPERPLVPFSPPDWNVYPPARAGEAQRSVLARLRD